MSKVVEIKGEREEQRVGSESRQVAIEVIEGEIEEVGALCHEIQRHHSVQHILLHVECGEPGQVGKRRNEPDRSEQQTEKVDRFGQQEATSTGRGPLMPVWSSTSVVSAFNWHRSPSCPIKAVLVASTNERGEVPLGVSSDRKTLLSNRTPGKLDTSSDCNAGIPRIHCSSCGPPGPVRSWGRFEISSCCNEGAWIEGQLSDALPGPGMECSAAAEAEAAEAG